MNQRFMPHLSNEEARAKFDEMINVTLEHNWVEVLELIHIGVAMFK